MDFLSKKNGTSAGGVVRGSGIIFMPRALLIDLQSLVYTSRAIVEVSILESGLHAVSLVESWMRR